jgi:uncharacterized membrane protein
MAASARLVLPYYRSGQIESTIIGFLFCEAVASVFLVASEPCRHWFMVPLVLCGTAITGDAVDWLRGRVDLFDPAGILGFLGVHFFFLAPLLHVFWNAWTIAEANPPAEWRDWLGYMATLNFIGLLAYRSARNAVWRRRPRNGSVWTLRKRRFIAFLGVALAITLLAQVYVYASFGGISGYIDTYMNHPEDFQGTGWQLMISESFPILAMIGFAVWARRRDRRWTGLSIVLVLAAFCAVQLLFGGLRGSRSNTVWALFWAAGIVHLWVRRIPKTAVFAGMALLLVFLYVYGFYKEQTDKNLSLDQRIAIAKKRGRTLQGEILGDLGRADVQAYVLYRIASPGSDYEFAYGRTYLGAAALLIPRTIWPERPPTSVEFGTNMQHYMGAYEPGKIESSKVYGLAGEAMLNFGPSSVTIAFVTLGLLTGWVRRMKDYLLPFDCRLLLTPLLVNLCFAYLAGDSDTTVFFLFKQGLLPAGLIALCSSRRRLKWT